MITATWVNAVSFQNFLEKIVIEATVGVSDDGRKN